LLDGWTTRDLATHLVLRERDHIAGPCLVLPGPFGRFAEQRRARLAEQREFGWLVARIRSAAIGVAQEFQRVWTAYQRQTSTGTTRWWFTTDDRRVSCYYFYLYDLDFGPAFVKICTYFPYPAKIWINGHEWAKRQARHAGIGFTELSN